MTARCIFASTRDDGHGVWAVDAAGGAERKLAPRPSRHRRGQPGGRAARLLPMAMAPAPIRVMAAEVDGKSITGNENVFPFRPVSCPDGIFLLCADGKIKQRGPTGADSQTIRFHGHAGSDARRRNLSRAGSAISTARRRARRWASCGRCSRLTARPSPSPPWATSM